jgi:hypothetical protein
MDGGIKLATLCKAKDQSFRLAQALWLSDI